MSNIDKQEAEFDLVVETMNLVSSIHEQLSKGETPDPDTVFPLCVPHGIGPDSFPEDCGDCVVRRISGQGLCKGTPLLLLRTNVLRSGRKDRRVCHESWKFLVSCLPEEEQGRYLVFYENPHTVWPSLPTFPTGSRGQLRRYSRGVFARLV